MKVGIVGSGLVGSTAAYAIVMSRAASEVVLIDLNEKVARAILVVTSNPVDIMTEVVCRISGLTAGRVFGTGTILDTARFRTLLAEFAQQVSQPLTEEVKARSLEAMNLGEVCLSLPRVLGADGIGTTLRPALDASERVAIERSARVLREEAAEIPV